MSADILDRVVLTIEIENGNHSAVDVDNARGAGRKLIHRGHFNPI
jgi:hypothetical protein